MKLGIIATAGTAFHFLLTNFVSIVRIGWLPTTLLLSVQYLSDAIYAATPLDPVVGESASVRQLIPFAATLLTITTISLVNVTLVAGYLRIIFERDYRRDVLAYFWFGRVELRYLVSFVALLGALVPFAGAAAALLAGAEALVDSGVGFSPLEFFPLLVIAGMVWVWLKLSLQSAVIMREGGLGFVRGWRILRGNAFRLTVVFVLTIGPIWALGWFATVAVLGADSPPLPEWRWQIHEWALTLNAYLEWRDGVLTLMATHPLERFVIDFLTTVLEYALIAGAIGSAYLQLSGTQD